MCKHEPYKFSPYFFIQDKVSNMILSFSTRCLTETWTVFDQRLKGTVQERNKMVKKGFRFPPDATERLNERYRFQG